MTGDYGSDIDIAVVHPDAIGVQNPYDQLEYENSNLRYLYRK